MAKNQIQNERNLRYFLDSAKNIVRSEGIEALSVRSVADRAGFSYATLYNYYKDVKELSYMSACEFIDEGKDYVLKSEFAEQTTAELIKSKVRKLCEFYVQYFGIYQLLYVAYANKIGNVSELKDKLNDLHNDLFKDDLAKLYPNDYELKMDILVNVLTGALLLYINRGNPESFVEFRNGLDKQIDMILN